MARTLSTTNYPLLKVLVPLAVIVFAVGLYMFFTNTVKDPGCTVSATEDCQVQNPLVLLWYGGAAALIAFASLLWKRKEEVTVLLPTDRLHEATRQDLQGILETLEKQREKGELTPERYTKARNRVLQEMKGTK